jgi:hypothetical protein
MPTDVRLLDRLEAREPAGYPDRVQSTANCDTTDLRLHATSGEPLCTDADQWLRPLP